MELFSLELWSDIIVQAVSLLLLTLVTLATRSLMQWLHKKGVVETIVAKEELAMIAVGFVEQAYRNIGGAEKFEAAVGWMGDRLTENGIKAGPDEIGGLIEEAVRRMKQEWKAVQQ